MIRVKAEAIMMNTNNDPDYSPSKAKIDKSICDVFLKGMGLRLANKMMKVDLREVDHNSESGSLTPASNKDISKRKNGLS